MIQVFSIIYKVGSSMDVWCVVILVINRNGCFSSCSIDYKYKEMSVVL